MVASIARRVCGHVSLDYNSSDSPTKVIVFEGGDGGLDERTSGPRRSSPSLKWVPTVGSSTSQSVTARTLVLGGSSRCDRWDGYDIDVHIGLLQTRGYVRGETLRLEIIEHVADFLNGIVSLRPVDSQTRHTRSFRQRR